MGKKIFVTSPALPDLNEYQKFLKKIWDSGQLTNNGPFHSEFENRIQKYLGAKQCSLFCNGTLALIIGIKALRLTGEIITTPFSFVATTHSIYWNDIQPVFCDIDSENFNIDPAKIEALITNKTSAILPVHVYGYPCDTSSIQEIADVYGLKVIYDAAHAFGVKINDEPIANLGDMSILSFHATKVFNSVEGGAIVHSDPNLKKRIDYLKNFGFANETTIVGTGINAKLNELLSAFGILQLDKFQNEVDKRKTVAEAYRSFLKNLKGINFFYDCEGVKHNYSYFPIRVEDLNGKNLRDELYNYLRENDIYTRRYFFPLISQIPAYRNLPSARPENLPVAEKVSRQILALPIYGNLELIEVERICTLIESFTKKRI